MDYRPFFAAFLLITLNLSTTLVANTAVGAGADKDKKATRIASCHSSSSSSPSELPTKEDPASSDINALDVNGDTLLIRTIRDRDFLSEHELIDQVDQLIGQGSDLNIQGGEQTTALMHAAKKGYANVVKHLSYKGASISLTDHYGRTALFLAIAAGQRETVRCLIELGIDINAKIYHDGIYYCTPLMYAAEFGFVDIIELLIELSADVDAQDQEGKTALTRAAMQGHLDTVERLIAAGTHVDARDHHGRNALWHVMDCYSVDTRTLGIVNRLIMHGCNIHCASKNPTDNGQTILMNCMNILLYQKNNDDTIEIIQRLLDCGIDVNAMDWEGNNALIRCVLHTSGRLIDIATFQKVLALLIAAGADINAINPQNHKTALMMIDRSLPIKGPDPINWRIEYNRMITNILIQHGAI